MPTVIKSAKVEFEHPRDYHAELTAPTAAVRFLEIPKRRYLMIDGTAKPGEQEFSDSIASLYPVAYTLHFALKRKGVVAPVGALEGLYWIGKPGPITVEQFKALTEHRATWTWRLMLPVPDAAIDQDIRLAIDEVRAKKQPPLLGRLRCQAWEEGKVAQTMHVGPYDAETATIEELHRAIEGRGLRLHGCHHEIYISDPNRTKPERLKTLLRQPVG